MPAPKDSAAQRRREKERASTEPEGAEQPAEPPARRAPTGVLHSDAARRGGPPTARQPDARKRDRDAGTVCAPLLAAFLECAQGQRGVAQLDITLIDSGAVSHVVVGGDFAGSTQGSCIARAARTAQFAPFKKPRFRLVYPISL